MVCEDGAYGNMTNEKRLQNGDISYVLRSSVVQKPSPKEAFENSEVRKEESKQNGSLVSTPFTPAILRMLESLRFTPRVANSTLENGKVLISSWSEKQGRIDDEKSNGLTKVSWTHEASTNHSPRDSSPDTSKRNDSASDSFSDSTYSQFSDISSDVRSQRSTNTISTDSDNSRFFQQALQIRSSTRRDKSLGATGVTDDDEAIVRKVLMLMKVILYLRQNYTTVFIYRPKILIRTREGNVSVPRNSRYRTSLKTETSPQTRKRISFSPATLLFSAIAEKSFTEAKAILDTEDVDVNTQTPSGQSLLHVAAGNADLKCIELLLHTGAQVNIKDSNGWSPLHAAIRRGNWKSAILLIEAGADIAEYAQKRIQEYQSVLEKSRNCYRAVEIFV